MIPKGWEEKTLGEVLDKGSSNLSANKLNNSNGIYSVYGASGLVAKVNFYQQDNEYLAIIKDGAGVGRVYHYGSKTSVLGTLQYLCPKQNINIRFAYYYLQSIDFTKYYQGAAIPHIYYSDYKNEKFILPPLSEQKRIVAKLDKTFEAIDKLKTNAEKNLKNVRELFESSLNKLFTENTNGWEEKMLFELGEINTGTTPKTSEKDNFGSYIPFIKPTDFNIDGSLNYNNEGLSEKGLKKARFIHKNSVLMVCIGATITKTGYSELDITCNQQINTLTPKKDNYKFIYYAMISKKFKQSILSGCPQTTLPIINKSSWSILKIKLPKIEMQQKIVNKLDKLQEKTKQLENFYTHKIQLLDELKQSILNKAFKGEL